MSLQLKDISTTLCTKTQHLYDTFAKVSMLGYQAELL